MSDSESDIDFESADEGEDQNNSENTSGNQSTWENRKKIHSESELMKREENENFKSSDKITNSADASFELERTREPECNTLVKDEMQTNHLSTPCKESITDNKNNEIDRESSICKQVIQKVKDELSDKSASFPKEIEPKRITLRLEKKLQQKNHETSSHDLQEESQICEKPQEEIKRVTLRLEKKLQQKNQKTVHHIQEESEICGKLQEVKVQESKPSLWGWGSWGTTLLSSAASSVSTFTTHVSEGIGTVLETVETTLGAPPPEELAATLKENSDCLNVGAVKSEECIGDEAEEHEDEENLGSSLLGGVTSWSKAIENTGAKVLMGGLDTLELIGKKTIDILTEGDPGLRKKRSVFSQGTTLSQVLREAKEKAEELNAAETDSEQDETVHYSKLFDEFQGLIHLEALEMLSGQSQTKVHGLLMLTTDSVKKNYLEEIKLICENLPSPDDTPDEADQDFSNLVAEHVQKLQLSVNTEKIKFVQMAAHDWIANCKKEQDNREIIDPKVIYHHGISCLAEFTSKSVEQFHRVAELILVKANAEDDPIHSATHLTGLTSVLCIEIGIIASKFCQCLSTAADDSENPDLITPLITSVYLEASNSTTYIQDAFQLLVPVLQLLLFQREK